MNRQVKALVDYVNGLSDFTIVTEIDGNYNNMGATIIDGILQTGINYKTTVKPRVNNYLHKYPNIKTTKEFKLLIDQITIPILISWKQSAKTDRIYKLTEFLLKEFINTEEEFKEWLENPSNMKKIKKLSGIKDKTADYFRILTGHKTNAIDRHLLKFLKQAGITVSSYEEAQNIISETSKLLKVDESCFDHSIWKYMSESKEK